MSRAFIALLSLAACDPRPVSAPREPTTTTALVDVEPLPPPATRPRASPSPSTAPLPTTTRTPGGGCDPMPRVGAPCGDDDGYCVESWGTPGGHSSALWCRGGRWEREEEANLP